MHVTQLNDNSNLSIQIMKIIGSTTQANTVWTMDTYKQRHGNDPCKQTQSLKQYYTVSKNVEITHTNSET